MSEIPSGCSRHVQNLKMADTTRATFVTFVSQKISKIRWKHTAKHTLEGSDCFATGSWDDEVFIKRFLMNNIGTFYFLEIIVTIQYNKLYLKSE